MFDSSGQMAGGADCGCNCFDISFTFFDFPSRQMYLLAKQYRNFSKWKHFAKMFIQSKCLTRVWFSVRSKIWLRLAKMKLFFFLNLKIFPRLNEVSLSSNYLERSVSHEIIVFFPAKACGFCIVFAHSVQNSMYYRQYFCLKFTASTLSFFCG